MFPSTTYSIVHITRYSSIVPSPNPRIFDTQFTFTVFFICPVSPSPFIQPSAPSSTLQSACISHVGTVSTFSHSEGCQYRRIGFASCLPCFFLRVLPTGVECSTSIAALTISSFTAAPGVRLQSLHPRHLVFYPPSQLDFLIRS